MPWQSSDRKSDLPPDWEILRTKVLLRDRYLCQIRGPRCTKRATEVDHVGARTDHRLEVLRSVCETCHGRRSAQQGNEAKARLKRARKRPQGRHPGSTT